MRGRIPRPGDRAIGVVLGIVLGLVVIILFLFLGSRSTIDAPSLSGQATQTQTQTVPAPQKTPKKLPGEKLPGG